MVFLLAGIEVKEAQLATHYVASERLPALEEMLHAMDPQSQSPEQILRSLQTFEVGFHSCADGRPA